MDIKYKGDFFPVTAICLTVISSPGNARTCGDGVG